ncbi:MAG: single-stranded DNA-binding protein [Paludibacteraceae bacterium]|nr:single-stranded DNA-binding protein [Paludibacteraceae bacterium]
MSVNKVILVGNVGKDPEVRYVDQNTAVANFTLATTDRAYTAANGTQYPERTEWHNIVAWRGLAKIAESYIRKGTSLYIEGKIRSRTWQDQNGNNRYITEIVADSIELLGKRPEGGVAPLQPNNNNMGQPAQPYVQPTQPIMANEPAQNYQAENPNLEDNFPF